MAVRDLPSAPQKALKPDRIERDGSSLVVYRPPPEQHILARNNVTATRPSQELRKGSSFASSAVLPAAAAAGAAASGVAALTPGVAKPVAVSAPSSFPSKRIDERTSFANRSSVSTVTPVAKSTVISTPARVQSPQVSPSVQQPQVVGVPQAKPVNERRSEPVIARYVQPTPQPVATVPQLARPVSSPGANAAPVQQTQSRPQIVNAPQVRISQQPNSQVAAPRPTYVAPQPVYRQPAYNPPAVQQYRPQPAPSYSVPQRYEAPRSAPSYSPPAPRAAPSYSPPAQQHSVPASSSRGKNEK